MLHNVRRREVSEALGMSLGRIPSDPPVGYPPMAMSELASALGIDAPYATVVVDDLESQGPVRRRPHPVDRRAKVVEATRKGREAARRADEILGTLPPALDALSPRDLETLLRILGRIEAEGA